MNHRKLLTRALLIAFAATLVGGSLRAQSPGRGPSPIAEPLEGISEAFRSTSQGTWIFLVFFLFLIALALGLVCFDLYVRRRNKVGLDNPRYLFTELVRVHELNHWFGCTNSTWSKSNF